MNLKKIGITVVAITFLVGGGATNITYAKNPQENPLASVAYQEITPLWNNIADISPYISSEGNTLYPEVYIKAKSTAGSISGTMYLERYDLGRWLGVTSWNFNGTSYVFLSKIYTGISGVKYRTRVVVTVDGEKAEATSGSCDI